MAAHNELGKLGEELAVSFLTGKGFSVLYRNWRYSHFEIDLVVTKNGLLHFVEVEHRASAAFGMPEESVRSKKFRSLLKGIEAFLHCHPQFKNFSIDILSNITAPGKEPQYFFIEDVYL